MRKIGNLFIIGIVILIGTLSCSNSSKYQGSDDIYSMAKIVTEEERSSADQALDQTQEIVKKEDSQNNTVKFTPPQTLPNFIVSSAASSTFDDGVHKFIRTAKTKFKVKDIVFSTQAIEDIAIKNKGFIIKSAITNGNLHSETINTSKDSATVNHYYNLTANIDLKIPASNLDSVLRQIAPLAVLVDYRTIEAEDITIKLMADQLAQIRLGKRQKRISNAINTTGRKLNDVMDAEDALDAALEEADRKTISEYNINEQIAYSTVTIDLYQDKIEYSEMILRKKAIKEYTPGFGTKLIDAISSGWSILCVLILFFINIWPLLILLTIGAFFYIRIRRKKEDS
ncbi:DUF4349 domain-containing protein [Dysgonomonas sp. Marseille-P4677]|uniref:DUF4349 domain-containing protein n=1 Tax=Dysgonomonas sp. Marseille-P4677 TaxID=2364790 RepID=UPI0019138F13|nr:DUF4349 domain-containing protein [Dysgonomonas sp. Marseille-P4677]MBK5719749.1 DUF4349 domain-containing protein [Dysgonomonas sp. Marseille-P4677]